MNSQSSSLLESLLMSRMFRRYVESAIVFWFPWVLLLEQTPVTMDEVGRNDEDISGRKV